MLTHCCGDSGCGDGVHGHGRGVHSRGVWVMVVVFIVVVVVVVEVVVMVIRDSRFKIRLMMNNFKLHFFNNILLIICYNTY